MSRAFLMRRVYQREHGGEGQTGDCFSACIATILGEQPVAVPFFYAGVRNGEVISDTTLAAFQSWLAARDLSYVEFAMALKIGEIFEQVVRERFRGPCVLTGRSFSGRVHSVVCLNGVVWHDPAPLNARPVYGVPYSREGLKPLSDGTVRLGLLVPIAL